MIIVIDLYAKDGDPLYKDVRPAQVVHKLGLKYAIWEAQEIADQIVLRGVDSTSLPQTLPFWMRVVL